MTAPSATPSDNSSTMASTTVQQVNFGDGSVSVVEDEPIGQLSDPTQELLVWHYKLGHLPFPRIQAMAQAGDLPKRLAKARIPVCAPCRFGRATKIPWRTRGTQQGSVRTATQPGQVISVDQLESTTPGLIAQLKGIPTKARYRYVTVFVDHYSGLSFVYMMKTITGEETVQAKRAFEAYANHLGVRIQHYHCDNGRFADKAFIKAVTVSHQSISYCGVNAHFQNGVAESAS